jgi:hypothetical protein
MLGRLTSKPFKIGKSYAVTLAPALRNYLTYRPGDWLLMTMVDGYVVICPLDAERILPRQEARQVVTKVQKSFSAEASNG